MQDTLTNTVPASDFGSWTTDPNRADYACDAYQSQLPRWKLVKDLRGGTMAIRLNRDIYLPKFDAESDNDYNARVAQTFVNEWYGETLDEHVGLVHSVPIKLGEDVPKAIVDLCEDIDGEGNHIEVFSQDLLDRAMHWGHAAIVTDYPATMNLKSRQDERAAKTRPYAQLFDAPDILSWQETAVGGKKVITQVMLREHYDDKKAAYGTTRCAGLRELKQEVYYDEFTGRANGLGACTWTTFKQEKANEPPVPIESGPMSAPRGKPLDRLPVRVVYGGQKLGTLNTKPHLMGIAFSNIEETQVASDFAAIMHKCNVPTPYFVNRHGAGDGTPLKLGEGIDIGLGGSAGYMEPQGTAIDATLKRLERIERRIRMQGATSPTDKDSLAAMTAAQARMIAKAKNAKIRKAARSLQDGVEGMFADIAMFLGIETTSTTVKSGGSVEVNQNFAGDDLDPAYLAVLVQAYDKGAFPLEALLFALKNGKLPDEFKAEDEALKLIAEQEAKAEEDRQMAEDLAKAASGAKPPAPGGPPVPAPAP